MTNDKSLFDEWVGWALRPQIGGEKEADGVRRGSAQVLEMVGAQGQL